MIDNRKLFVNEVLFLLIASNKITEQKLLYNCEHVREEILAITVSQFLILMIFSFKSTMLNLK